MKAMGAKTPYVAPILMVLAAGSPASWHACVHCVLWCVPLAYIGTVRVAVVGCACVPGVVHHT